MIHSQVCGSRAFWTTFGVSWLIGSLAFGADPNAVAIKEVLTDLKNPRGLAIRPDGSGETCEVFVAESGAGRVIKIRSDHPEKRIDVVSGFSTRPANDDGVSSPAVQSLFFLVHMRLVAAGRNDDGTPFVKLY